MSCCALVIRSIRSVGEARYGVFVSSVIIMIMEAQVGKCPTHFDSVSVIRMAIVVVVQSWSMCCNSHLRAMHSNEVTIAWKLWSVLSLTRVTLSQRSWCIDSFAH